MFLKTTTVVLVPIVGHHPGAWEHVAFVPDPLPDATPSLRSDSVRRRGDYRYFPIGPEITAGLGR